MKADERKHLKENELASRLGQAWQTVASGSTTNTIIWGVIVLGLVLAVGWRFYSDAAFRGRSALWSELALASDFDELRQIVKEHPGTTTARVARYHLARSLMQEATGRLAGPITDERQKAADNLEEARKLYAELSRESSVEPALIQEALMGVAKADEILASVPKADNDNVMRATLDDAQKAYEDLAKKYPESVFGKEAAKRAKELTDRRTHIEALYAALRKEHGKPPPPLPAIPAMTVPAPPVIGPTLPDAPKDAAQPPLPKPADVPVPPPPTSGAPKEEPKAQPKDPPKAEGPPKGN